MVSVWGHKDCEFKPELQSPTTPWQHLWYYKLRISNAKLSLTLVTLQLTARFPSFPTNRHLWEHKNLTTTFVLQYTTFVLQYSQSVLPHKRIQRRLGLAA